MKLIELEERKEIQMQILDAVDHFCTVNNIPYSLSCGTMLGAIRHGGYIPWDDDIDIYMLRKDYDKFESLFPNIYQEKYQLASLTRLESWCNVYSKVWDNRTLIVEKILEQSEVGINIDIFPIDDVPDNDVEWIRFNKRRRKDFEITRKSALCVSKNRPIWQNLVIPLIRLRYIFLDRKKFGLYRNKMVQQFNGKGYNRVFETSSGMRVKKPFPKKLFNDLIYIPFENRKYQCFKNYDEYLTDTFGDYMTPPPIEKRISFHTYDTYWK